MLTLITSLIACEPQRPDVGDPERAQSDTHDSVPGMLDVAPSPVDFGTAYIGCENHREVALTNIGEERLILTDLTLTGDRFALLHHADLPATLEPGDEFTLGLAFSPQDEGVYDGTLAISSASSESHSLSLIGTAEYAGVYQESFEVNARPPVDVIFYVEQSSSMEDDIQALGENFQSFAAALSMYTDSWQVMVANHADGCNNGTVFSENTADAAQLFKAAISAGRDVLSGSGLHLTALAVAQMDDGDCNANFLRANALLHVVLVSDSADRNAGDWERYVDQVSAKKGYSALVKFSAIAGDYPAGCTSGGNSADVADGYYEAVQSTGGAFRSICGDWADAVDALAGASTRVTANNDFELIHAPAEATITVEVNGSPATTGWSYVEATNSIRFEEPSIPAEGDIVTIVYAGLASCD